MQFQLCQVTVQEVEQDHQVAEGKLTEVFLLFSCILIFGAIANLLILFFNMAQK